MLLVLTCRNRMPKKVAMQIHHQPILRKSLLVQRQSAVKERYISSVYCGVDLPKLFLNHTLPFACAGCIVMAAAELDWTRYPVHSLNVLKRRPFKLSAVAIGKQRLKRRTILSRHGISRRKGRESRESAEGTPKLKGLFVIGENGIAPAIVTHTGFSAFTNKASN